MPVDGDLKIGLEASSAEVGVSLGYAVHLQFRQGTVENDPVWDDITLDPERLDRASDFLDVRVVNWGDGARVLTSGANLVVVGADDKGLLHIRVFDAVGDRVCDTDETQHPDQRAAIATLKQRLTDVSPAHELTDADKEEIYWEVISIVGRPSRDPYGAELTRQVFAGASLRRYFREAFLAVQRDNACLHVRMNLGRGAETLHTLNWERLEVPFRDGTGARQPIALHPQMYFARFLGGLDWRSVRLRRRGEGLRVVVAVANPSDPDGGFGLAPINVEAELLRARRALGVVELEEEGPPDDATSTTGVAVAPPLIETVPVTGPDTLNQVVSALQAIDTDVLYVVCHGMLDRATAAGRVVSERALLFLEGASGEVAPTVGETFVQRLAELVSPPRLVVLASCQSGGIGDEALSGQNGALAAVGPKLAQAGIPAVLALQARFPMSSASLFFRRFFKEFASHGQVDRATANARGLLRGTPAERDAWIPVLYTRLTDGRIWYVPGMATNPGGRNVAWDTLLDQIKEGLDFARETGCTPVLGPGMLEPVVGPLRDLARSWAEEAKFALAPHLREDLLQVLQFLITTQRRIGIRSGIQKRIDIELERRFGNLPGADVSARLAKARAMLYDEPHRLLARLPFPMYVTVNPDDQLSRALEAEGRKPVTLLFPWHELPNKPWPRNRLEPPPDYTPTPERPLVYHLFGQWDELHSLVLTEDDYFAFLAGVSHGMQWAPPVVRTALVKSALLFLGFRLDGWAFRVVFRSILSLGALPGLNDDYPHVAAQVAPEEGRHIDTERAREYLQASYGELDLSIYWGTAADFVSDLCRLARARGLFPYRPGVTS